MPCVKIVACSSHGVWLSGLIIYLYFLKWIADAKDYLHVHPLFLHSNATSHKWVFGGMSKDLF